MKLDLSKWAGTASRCSVEWCGELAVFIHSSWHYRGALCGVHDEQLRNRRPTKAEAGLSIPTPAGFDSPVGRHVTLPIGEYIINDAIKYEDLERIAKEKGHEVNATDWRRFVDRQLSEFFRTATYTPISETPKMSIKFLKVKIKSLAAEARIIRFEERRTRGELREALHLHRVIAVRSEARAAHLAYAFLRGRPLLSVDRAAHATLIVGGHLTCWKRVDALVKKYGSDPEYVKGLSDWIVAEATRKAA